MIDVIVKRFEGFEDADFDAFRPEKWLSNRFNRERMVVRHKLMALGAASRRRDGERLAGLDAETSDDRPSHRNQRSVDHMLLYLLRRARERRTVEPVIHRQRPMALMVADPALHHQHAHLAVRVDLAGVDVALQVFGHAHVDVANLKAVVADEERGAALLATLQGLGEGWDLFAEPGDRIWPVAELDLDALRTSLTVLAEPFGVWGVRRKIPRTEAEALSEAGFADQAGAWLEALLAAYQAVAWSPDNDRIGLGVRLEQEARQRADAEAQAAQARLRQEEERLRRQQEARARAEAAQADRRYLAKRMRRPRAPDTAPVLKDGDTPPPAEGEAAPPEAVAQAAGSAAAEAAAPKQPPAKPAPPRGGPGSGARGAEPGADRRGPGPRDQRRGPGPRDQRRGPGPRDQRRGPGPRDQRRGPGPGPRDQRRGPGTGPRDQRRGPGPRDDRRGPGSRDGQRRWSERRGRRDDGPRRAGDPGRPDLRGQGRCGGGRRSDGERGRSPERRPTRPKQTFSAGEKVRFERGLVAGKEGSVVSVDSSTGLVTVAILNGLTVRVAAMDLKKLR